MSPEIIEIIDSFGIYAVVVLLGVVYFVDRGRAESKTEVSIANIAVSNTKQVSEIYKDMGVLRQELGKSEGKVEILQQTLDSDRARWDTERRELLDKITKLSSRIAELEREDKSKSELIATLRIEKQSIILERDMLKREVTDITNKLESTIASQNNKHQTVAPLTDKIESEVANGSNS